MPPQRWPTGTHPQMHERRRVNDPWREDVTAQLAYIHETHEQFRRDIAITSEMLTRMTENTDEMVKMFRDSQGFFRIAKIICASVASFLAAFAAGMAYFK